MSECQLCGVPKLDSLVSPFAWYKKEDGWKDEKKTARSAFSESFRSVHGPTLPVWKAGLSSLPRPCQIPDGS